MPRSALLPRLSTGAPSTSQRTAEATDAHVNDLDLKAWRDYSDIITDSLWLIPERDHTGAHSAEYHGNFVPQIPHQMMRRYTRKGDIVIDPFFGCGTTGIEGRRLGRHVIGIELQEHVAQVARERMRTEPNPYGVESKVYTEDTRSSRAALRVRTAIKEMGHSHAHLIVMHPPYHDIIKFSDRPEDLSNAPDLEEYLTMFRESVANYRDMLAPGHYLVLVIGDKYAAGEWVPLGFHTMQEVVKQGFQVKSIIVKNMAGNRAKRNLDNLWRYRALSGGFYIFKHEYVMVFRKTRNT